MLEVQSLSVCVPAGCPNKCKFCISRMHSSVYEDQIEKNLRFFDLYERDYCKRLQFARDNGCNTVILTGDGEPLFNIKFLKDFSHWNHQIESPFRWIEIQTSGVSLDDEKLRFLRNTVGVTSISLSLSNHKFFGCIVRPSI
jgi:sulfatase maturation enzyme AslB (radical SAM superfamily)